MKLIFTVTGATKVNDGRMLVQLAGKHGHVALDLPLGHAITVGQEFVLESDVFSISAIDEVAQRGFRAGAPGIPKTSPIPTTPPGFKP